VGGGDRDKDRTERGRNR